MTRRAIVWATAALAGIVVTAALAWFASQLAVQRIGLSSEPLSVTSGLAPARDVTGTRLKPGARPARRPRSSHPTHAVSRSQPTTTVYIAPAPAPAPASAPATSAPVVTPPPSATSTAQTATPAGSSSIPRQRDDNGGGSGNGGGSSHGGGQRDD